jgi:hypothetical protein
VVSPGQKQAKYTEAADNRLAKTPKGQRNVNQSMSTRTLMEYDTHVRKGSCPARNLHKLDRWASGSMHKGPQIPAEPGEAVHHSMLHISVAPAQAHQKLQSTRDKLRGRVGLVAVGSSPAHKICQHGHEGLPQPAKCVRREWDEAEAAGAIGGALRVLLRFPPGCCGLVQTCSSFVVGGASQVDTTPPLRNDRHTISTSLSWRSASKALGKRNVKACLVSVEAGGVPQKRVRTGVGSSRRRGEGGRRGRHRRGGLRNAFNALSRQTMLDAVAQWCPAFLPTEV